MRPIIVGIDPGTTTAFAAISFDFKVLAIRSKKEYGISDLISDVYKVGNPIILGTDKKDIPSFIKEFSQKTGCKIFAPKYDTKKGEKLSVVKENNFYDLIENVHEVDSLASAIYAYNYYKQLILKILQFSKENNKEEILDKLLVKVICEKMNITRAAEELEEKPDVNIEKIMRRPASVQKSISREERQIMLLTSLARRQSREISMMKYQNEKLKGRKIDIKKETKKLISFKESRALELEKNNTRLKKFISLQDKLIGRLNSMLAIAEESAILKRLDNLGKDEFLRKNELLRIKNEDALLVKDISIASDHVVKELQPKIKIIFYEGNINKAIENKFILIPKVCPVKETKYFSLISMQSFKRELDKAITGRKGKEVIKNILEDYKRERQSEYIK